MVEIVTRDDTVMECGRKVFHTYDVGMSCTIVGFVEMPDGEIKSKGELVWENLIQLDKVHNFVNAGKTHLNGQRRRRVMPENCCGDYLRNKTFKYQKNIIDNQVRYTIWRIQ